MAKALVLSEEALAAPPPPPRAAQSERPPAPAEAAPAAPKPVKPPQTPLQIRIEASQAKAIKRAALEADQTLSEFMLACFHAYMKNG